MKITNLLVFGFAAVAAAEDSSCLSEDQGQKILARYISSFVNPKLHTVNLTFTRNFKYYSDSNDFLAGLPVSRRRPNMSSADPNRQPASSTGVPYYANRVELYNDQVRTAENNAQSFKDVGFKILQSTIGCDTITFRWRFEVWRSTQSYSIHVLISHRFAGNLHCPASRLNLRARRHILVRWHRLHVSQALHKASQGEDCVFRIQRWRASVSTHASSSVRLPFCSLWSHRYTSGYPICFQKNANVTCAPANSTTSASSTKFFQLPK